MNNPFLLFLKLSRPFFLLSGLLFYALGAGIARYLGHPIDANAYLLGQLWVTVIQLATHYLNEYFDSPGDAANPNRTPFSGGSAVLGEGEGKLPPVTALLGAATAYTLAALATWGLARAGQLDPSTVTIMLLIFLGAFFYSVPPLRLAASGFGELTASILLANLVPALALLLQFGEFHRLLAMSTFPLTLLSLASMLVFEFPDYATDMKFEKRTLLIRLGWEQGMRIHSLFIIIAYMLVFLAYLLGLPAPITLPVLLTFPVGLLQIWYMRRIADGIKPNWSAFTLSAVVTTAAVAYLFTYAFWTR